MRANDDVLDVVSFAAASHNMHTTSHAAHTYRTTTHIPQTHTHQNTRSCGCVLVHGPARKCVRGRVTLALQVTDTGDYLGTLADWFPEVSRDDVVSLPSCRRACDGFHQLGCSQALVSNDRLLETPNELLKFVTSARPGPMQTPFYGRPSATSILGRTETHASYVPYTTFA